jgi:transcription termination factor Rho
VRPAFNLYGKEIPFRLGGTACCVPPDAAVPSLPRPGHACGCQAAPPVDNTIHVEGILDIDITKGGNGQLLDMAKSGKRRPTDTFVPKELIRRFKLKAGSLIGGTAFPPEGRFPNPKMRFIETVDGLALEDRRAMLDFASLTTVSPDKHLKLEMKDGG